MDSSARPTLMSTAGLALAVNIPIGFFAYGWGFVTAFMLNDMPDANDLRQFLAAGLVAVVLSVLLMTAIMVLPGRKPVIPAVRNAIATSALIHAAFLLVALPLLNT